MANDEGLEAHSDVYNLHQLHNNSTGHTQICFCERRNRYTQDSVDEQAISIELLTMDLDLHKEVLAEKVTALYKVQRRLEEKTTALEAVSRDLCLLRRHSDHMAELITSLQKQTSGTEATRRAAQVRDVISRGEKRKLFNMS